MGRTSANADVTVTAPGSGTLIATVTGLCYQTSALGWQLVGFEKRRVFSRQAAAGHVRA